MPLLTWMALAIGSGLPQSEPTRATRFAIEALFGQPLQKIERKLGPLISASDDGLRRRYRGPTPEIKSIALFLMNGYESHAYYYSVAFDPRAVVTWRDALRILGLPSANVRMKDAWISAPGLRWGALFNTSESPMPNIGIVISDEYFFEAFERGEHPLQRGRLPKERRKLQ